MIVENFLSLEFDQQDNFQMLKYYYSIAELSAILVGLLIFGRSGSEYIVFRNEVELLQSLLRRSILKSPHNIKS